MPTIFFIGATGHIGGAVLHQILLKASSNAGPSTKDVLRIRALARDDGKAQRLKAKFSDFNNKNGAGVELDSVVGDLNTLGVLEREAKGADVVINTAPDITHDDGVKAVLDGLSSRKSPSYYVHTSGASLLWDEPSGEVAQSRVWDDITDLADLKALIFAAGSKATHSSTDKLVMDATGAAGTELHAAIVSPVMVGGYSPFSTEHPVPISTGAIVATVRGFKAGFQINKGENEVGWVHVEDLARIYGSLVGDALGKLSSGNGADQQERAAELWGPDAYYFGCDTYPSWGDFMRQFLPFLARANLVEPGTTSDTAGAVKAVTVTEAARKALSGGSGVDVPDDAPPPPADSWAMHIAIMFGINMRVRSSRAEKMLGWKPKRGLMDDWEVILAEFLRREGAAAAEESAT